MMATNNDLHHSDDLVLVGVYFANAMKEHWLSQPRPSGRIAVV
jgi:hypothetical protein